MKTAFLFPGQGSQFAGMGQSLAHNFDAARLRFEEADEALHKFFGEEAQEPQHERDGEEPEEDQSLY